VQTRPDSKIIPRSSIRSSRQRDQQTQTEYYAAIIGGGLHGRRWRTIVLVLVAHYSYREFGMSVSALYQFESFLKPLSPQRMHHCILSVYCTLSVVSSGMCSSANGLSCPGLVPFKLYGWSCLVTTRSSKWHNPNIDLLCLSLCRRPPIHVGIIGQGQNRLLTVWVRTRSV
jgi:hypothetical protein